MRTFVDADERDAFCSGLENVSNENLVEHFGSHEHGEVWLLPEANVCDHKCRGVFVAEILSVQRRKRLINKQNTSDNLCFEQDSTSRVK